MKAVVYLRQSQDRTGEELGVTRQRQDARKLAKSRGWTVVAEQADNDLSASGKRKRPGFDAVLAAVDGGEAQAVIAWSMDRLTRNRRDTLRLIEAGERHGVHLAFVQGSDMDLSTPAGRLAADILAGVARHEIDQKSVRQRRAIAQAAEAGKRTGGRRPFGYLEDGVTLHPAEAAALAETYEQILSGTTMGRAARMLNEAGFTTPQTRRDGSPSPWTAQSLGLTLRNPRYGGLRAVGRIPEHGRKTWEIVGPAEWSGVVPEETWRAVEAVLAAPERRRPGRDGVGLLTGLGECGVCNDGTTVHRGAAPRGGSKTYRCRGSLGHFARRAEPIDAYVTGAVIWRLSQPDARDLLQDANRPNVGQLRAALTEAENRMKAISRTWGAGEITDQQFRIANDEAKRRFAEAEAGLIDARRASVLKPLLDDPDGDVAAAWDRLDTDQQRAALAYVLRVVVHPVGQGRRTAFDRASFARAARGEQLTEPERALVKSVRLEWRKV